MSVIENIYLFAEHRIYQDGTIPSAFLIKAFGEGLFTPPMHLWKDNLSVLHKELEYVGDSIVPKSMSNKEWGTSAASTIRTLEGEERMTEYVLLETMHEDILLMACHALDTGKRQRFAYQVLSIGDMYDLLKVNPVKYLKQIDEPLNAFVTRYNKADEDMSGSIWYTDFSKGKVCFNCGQSPSRENPLFNFQGKWCCLGDCSSGENHDIPAHN